VLLILLVLLLGVVPALGQGEMIPDPPTMEGWHIYDIQQRVILQNDNTGDLRVLPWVSVLAPPEASPTPLPSPSATSSPTVTSTPSPTPLVIPTSTPTAPVEATPTPEEGLAVCRGVVTADPRLNIRSGPGTTYGLVGSALKDDVLTIEGMNTAVTWFKIFDGWVSSSWIQLTPDSDCSEVPVIAPF
jgi:hypothetical protein